MANVGTTTYTNISSNTKASLYIYDEIRPVRYVKTGWITRIFRRYEYVKFSYLYGEIYNKEMGRYEVYNTTRNILGYFKTEKECLEDQFIEAMKGTDVQLGIPHHRGILKK